MIRALVFDLDNTLADRSGAFGRYADDFCRRRLPEISPWERAAVVREMLAVDDGGYFPRAEYCEWVATRFAACGLSAADVWRDHRDRLCEFYEPDPVVRRLLALLAPQYRLGVVTNGSALNQRRKLERTGVADLIECVSISEDAGAKKPEASIFLAILAALDCQPHEALYVGDDPWADIAGASRAGLETCWVTLGRIFPTELPAPDHIVPRLVDLKSILSCLMPGR